jgi:hypothetical protein
VQVSTQVAAAGDIGPGTRLDSARCRVCCGDVTNKNQIVQIFVAFLSLSHSCLVLAASN